MRSPIVLAVFCLARVVNAQTDNIDMMGIINMLYIKADQNSDGSIAPEELANIYEFMDQDHNDQVSKSEFTGVWATLTGYNQETCEAYFFLADLDGNGYIDRVDDNNIYARFDLNGDGTVQAQEFMIKYSDVYHEVPFVILFERVEKDNNNDQHLTKTEFSQLFKSFKTAADGSVAKADFLKTWTDSKFGSQQDAETVFKSFDANSDDVISTTEVGDKFSALDISGNGSIEILEAIALGEKAQA
ncbi:uncharacterized protein LOC131953590 [Physella acuta]|uniref:uncharacterized protein LOC131953590 n=1 Tax=Physella acuta TaxID=109671 RepID=UPI0027DC61F6|nr:uncharacterized protein LOC131953590 [Physella acuta]